MNKREMVKWCYDMGYSTFETRDRIKKAGHEITIQQVEEMYEQEAADDWAGDEYRSEG